MSALLALNLGFVMLPPAMAGPMDGIVTDGRTQTAVSAVGNTVSVNTATVKGLNAFNSFSQFNVQGGVIANMYVPNGANNLINIVSGARSNIDGVLNSISNGAIGGNVWFVNPFGLVVGASGVVNVGSLNVSTPTSQFVSNFFRAPGTPDDASVDQLLSGQAPRNPGATVSVFGRINAINGVALSAGAVNVSGSIFSGARFVGTAPNFSDVVNANGLANGTSVVVKGGQIQIVADSDVTFTALKTSGGTANIDISDASITGRNVTLDARSTLADSSLPVSTGINKAEAAALVNLQNATITAAADLVIRAVSVVSTDTNPDVPLPLSVQRVSSQASVEVGGTSVLTAGGNASLLASSTVTTRAVPVAPSATRAGDASVAVSDVASTAKVLVTGNSTITVAGSLDLNASNSVTVQAIANAAAAGGTAAGASVAVSKLRTETLVVVDGAAVVQAGTLTLDALSSNSVAVTAKAAAQGADKDETGTSKSGKYLDEYKNSAKTSDADATAAPQSDASGVKVAGAVAISDLASTTVVSLASSSAAVVGGAASLQSKSSNNVTVTADASSANGAQGVAVAVAINLGKTDNKAVVDQALTAGSLSLSAGMAPGSDTSAFTTAAVSGAGASNVGLAGSLAVNAIDAASTALLAQNAAFNRAGGNGAVTLAAVNNTSSTASATPGGPVTGDKVGIGASVAVNVVSTRTAATLDDHSSLLNAVNVSLSAAGVHTVSTTAEAGSAGGISITPASATSLVTNSTSADIGSGTTLSLGGDLSVKAQQTSVNTTSAKGSAVGGKAAIGAAVGVALIDDLVEATTARGVNATGNVEFNAQGASASNVAAVASASGGNNSADAGAKGTDGKPKEDASVDDKVGKQLDFGKKNQTDNGVGNAKQKGSTTKAVADQKSGKASASTSEGKVSVAAAVGVNIQNSTASATIPAGGNVTAGGKLTLKASNNTDGTVSADGSALPVAQGGGTAAGSTTKVGIGAAVAVNLVRSVNDAVIGQNAVVNVNGLSVNAGMTDLKGDGSDLVHMLSAQANSGAGGSSVGIAGSLALNLIDTSSQALVQTGATVNAGLGAVALTAEGNTDTTANAAPHDGGVTKGGKVGIGASVAVNVVANRVLAELQDGSVLNTRGNVTVKADAAHTTTTTAEAGSAGGISITPVLALAMVNNSTTARLGTSANAVTNAGSVTVSAQQATKTKTTAKGSAKGDDAAIGAAVAIALVNDVTLATTDRDISDATGDVSFIARSSSANATTSSASSKGGKSDDQAGATGTDGKKQEDATVDDKVGNQLGYGQQQQTKNNVGSAGQKSATGNATTAKPSAKSSEGKVSVAAAVSVNVVDVQTTASIADGRTVSTTGALGLNATGNTDSAAKSDGTAVGKTAQVGIGAAVSVNKVDSQTLAGIGNNANINAQGVTLAAGMTDIAADTTHTISAEAASGAGGSKVGIAASLALNLANTSSGAQIGTGATVNANANDVSLTALDRAAYTAKATPTTTGGATGGNVGVGVSVALNVIDAGAVASIGQNAGIVNARDLKLSAKSEADSEAQATSGAAGGKLAFDAAVAVTILSQTSEASIAAGVSAITAARNVELNASSSGRNTALATGEAKSGSVAVGAAVGVITSNSNTKASLDRSVTAGGTLGIAADSTRVYTSDATASAGGSQSQDSYDQNKTQADSASSSKSLSSNQSAQSNQGTSGGGKVAIAAAVGVTVLADKVEASVANSRTLSSGGAIAVSATQDSNFSARGAGDAVNPSAKVGVAVGVGIAISNSSTTAKLGDNTRITGAQDITVKAESTQNRDAAFANKLAAEGIAGAGGNKVGVAGAFAVVVSNAQTVASMGNNTRIDWAHNISLQANNTSMLGAKAWAVAIGGKVGVGASVATVVSNNEYKASVGSGSNISATSLSLDADNNKVAPGTFSLSVNSVDDVKTIPGQLTSGTLLGGANYYSEALAGAAGGTAAVSGAFAVNVFTDKTETALGANAVINLGNTGALRLVALNDTTSTSLAGAVAVGGKVGVGVSSAVAKSTNDTRSHIDAGTVVSNSGSISLNAANKQTIDLISFSGGVGGNVGISGTANVLLSKNTAQAYVADGAGTALTTSGNLGLNASNALETLNIASGVAVGGSVGVGVAAAINTVENITFAGIGNDARTNAAGATTVAAVAAENMTTFAVGAGGAGSVAVGGAALVNVMNNETTASIGDRARVNASAPLVNQSVSLTASNTTTIFDVAGGVAGGGSVGAGAAADVSVLSKKTHATVGAVASVDAAQDVNIKSSSTEDIRVSTVGLGVGGSAGLAGSAAAISLTTETVAAVKNSAALRAKGDVSVAADGSTTVDLIAGAVSVGGSAAVGAAAGVVVLAKTTKATIGDAAAITALGQGTGVSASNGDFTISYGSNITGNGRVADSGFTAKDANGTAVTGRSAFNALGKQRNAAVNTSLVNGVAVTATNKDSIKSFVVTGSGAGTAAIALGANVATVTTDTQATTGTSSNINQDTAFTGTNGGASGAQSVLIAAGNDQFHLGIAGAASAAGAVAVGAGADVFIAKNNVLAQIGANAQVKAARSVDVLARASEQVLGIGVGMAASGSVAVAGSVSVVSLDNTTKALIAGGTTRVDAGGNVQVNASDNSSVDMIAGAAAAGFGVAGVGAAVGVTSITKDTQAAVGNGSTVNALGGAGSAAMATFNGTTADATTTTKGLLVQATSSEDLFTVVASGAGGFYAGVSGAVAVEVIKSSTQASIGDNARINSTNGGADTAQDVNVTARNVVSSEVIVGSLAVGAVGLAGAVNVGIAKNNTTASIGAGTQVTANGNVTVNALGKQTYDSTVISAAGGLVGIAAGVAVYSIGDQLSAEAQGEISKNGSTVGAQADNEASDGSVSNMLASSDDARMQNVALQSQAKRTGVKVSNTFTATQPAGNSASIGDGAIIVAGGNLDVNARGKLDFTAKAGAVAVGAVSLGAGVGIANIKLNNQATLGNNVTVSVGTNIPSGDLRVNAALTENASAIGFAGTGGIVAVNAAYAGITDTSNTLATAGTNLHVKKADEVLLQATDARTVSAKSFGASAGLIAAGASVAQAKAEGNTKATIGAGANLGGSAGDTVRAVDVLADSTTRALADSTAIAGGTGLAISGAVATASAKPNVEASIAGGIVKATQDVTVRGTGRTEVIATARGVNLSLTAAAGVSKAVAEGVSTVNAYLGSNTAVTGRNLTVEARQILNGAGPDVKASATGASGALFVGVNATQSNASNTSNVTSRIGAGSKLTLTGAALVNATNNTQQSAEVSGVSAGIVAVGFNQAEATSNTTTEASLGDNVSVAAPTTTPASMMASLTVTANGTDINNAKATSGSGGLVSGAAASATTRSISNTTAKIGTGNASNVVAVTSLTLKAAHTSEFNSAVDSVNAAVVGASGANALNTVDSTVNTNVGGFVRARFVDIDAANTSRKAWIGNSIGDDAGWNINSGSGGVVDLPAATSRTNVSHSTAASIGAGADVHVLGGSSNGTFNMDALNTIVLQDKAKLDSGGVISVANANSIVNVTKSDATVSFGDNSVVVNDLGSVNAGARADVTLDARSSVNVYGLAGAPSGQAHANYSGRNTAIVGTNASIEASDGSVLLGAGQGSDGTVNRINANATVNLWNKTPFPIATKPDAQANVDNNTLVNIATGSNINAAEDIALSAEKGRVDVNAMGIGKDIYRELAAKIASGISNLFGGGDVNFDVRGESTSSTGLAKVNVDGTALTGINRAASLTLGIELIDANGNRVTAPVYAPVYETNELGQFVDAAGNVTTSGSNKIGDRVLWRRTIDKSDNVSIKKIDTAQSVSAGIQDRITKLRSLMSQYAGDAVAVGAYEAEVNFLMFKLVELGLASGTFAADGTPTNFNPGAWNNPSPQDASRSQILNFKQQAAGATTAAITNSATLINTAAAASTAAGTVGTNAVTVTASVTTLGATNTSVDSALLSLANRNVNDTDYVRANGLINANSLAVAAITSANTLIGGLKTSVTTASGQINTLITEINARTNTITTLRNNPSAAATAQIAVLNVEIDSRQATIATTSAQISGWVTDLSTQSASVAANTRTIRDNTATIKTLQTSLASRFSDGSSGNATIVSNINTSLSNSDATRTAIGAAYTTIDAQATAFSISNTGYVAGVASSETALRLALQARDSAQAQITTLTANLANLSSVAANGPIADFVHVDDITVKLGNIRTKGDQLTGTGALKAPGDARIDITNNTPDFLVLNKLTVNSDDGGTVRFNGVLVNSGVDVNRINTNRTGASGLQLLTRDTQGATVPQINVTSNYNPNGAGTVVIAPSPDIQLQGDITNLRGSVVVRSKAGSILSNANVNAGSVDVRADNGDFVQSYVDNFFHVGGDAGSIKDGLTTAGGGIVANGSVFISARYLNINSLVQSGIENWNITLPTAPKLTGSAAYFGVSAASIAAAQKAYDDALPGVKPTFASANLININGRAVTYNAVTQRIEVDMAWANADKVSGDWATRTGVNSGLYTLVKDYGNIGASYDPTNNRFVLDGTQVRGGSIQLYGQIMNTSETGGGILRALDGYGQITINNPTGLAVVINNLDTGADPTGAGRGIAGVIDITDIRGINGTRAVTERTIYKRENGVITKNAVAVAGTNRETTYNPQQGLRYNWTSGTDNSQERYWVFKAAQWFGSSSLRGSPSGEVTSQSELFTRNTYRLDDGTYLIKETNPARPNYDASTVSFNDPASPAIWTKTGEWTRCNWWTACIASKHYSAFTEQVFSKTTTTKSLKADNAIKVQFSGYDTGTVSINSNSNVLLAGAIRNNTGNTTINAGISGPGVTVSAGQSIIQTKDKALTSGKNVTLNASGSVGAALGSNPALAIALDIKNGVLNADARNGNVLVAQTVGDLKLGTVKAAGDALNGQGRVTLVSDGTISADNFASRVQGNLINLTSNNGGLGSTTSLLKVNVGYTDNVAQRGYYGIKAKAAGDIGIEATTEFAGNTAGNLLVDTIVSRGGDVSVKSPGTIVDNNATEQIDTRTWNQLKNYWDSMGLRVGTAENDANKAATVRAFEQSKTQDYRAYWDARLRQADQGVAYDANYQYQVTAGERSSLVASGVNVVGFEADRTAQYRRLNASVGGLTPGYSGSYSYSASAIDKFGADGKSGLLAKSSWTDRELALSISAGLLKEITNTNPVIKDANIQGRNVTITAGKSVGETDAALVIPTNVDPSCAVGLPCLTDSMKVALAAAERNDITITDGSITVLRRKPLNFAATEALNVGVTAAPVANTDTGNAYLASLGDARLGNVDIKGDVRIKVRGSIINASGSSAAVQTGNLILEAANGGIGYLPPAQATATGTSAPLRLNQYAGSTLTARAAKNIDIVESGDMLVDSVYSREDIKLAASAGSITDAFNDTELNVLAKSVDLTAIGGSIGTAANALEVSSGLTGKVSSTATGGINLNGPIGYSFNVGSVSAGSDIRLSSVIDMAITGQITGPAAIALSAGNEVSFSSTGAVTAGAQNVSVDANSLAMADGARLNATLGTVTINTAGNATITGISTGNNTAGAVSITSGGNVIDGGDTRLDITADGGVSAKVTINATGSIGKGNPLEIKTANVKARASGSADMAFDGPIAIDTVTAGDRIAIAATGTISGNSVIGTGLGADADQSVSVISSAGQVNLALVQGKGDVTVDGKTGVAVGTAISSIGGVKLSSSDGDVVIDKVKVGGTFVLATTSGNASVGSVDADSAIITAPKDVVVGQLDVKTRFLLQGTNVIANIFGGDKQIRGIVTGFQGGTANAVTLALSSPAGTLIEKFKTRTATIKVPAGPLDVLDMLVVGRATVKNPLTTVIIDQNDRSIQSGANVQLYSGGLPFTLSLFDNHVIGNPFVIYRDARYDALVTTGLNQSIIETSEKMLTLSTGKTDNDKEKGPRTASATQEKPALPKVRFTGFPVSMNSN